MAELAPVAAAGQAEFERATQCLKVDDCATFEVCLHGDQTNFPSSAPADVASNLDWAIARLRTLYARHKDDATLRCDLGEALASQTKYHAEAFNLLDNLEQRDLVVSSRAYAKLSKLRRARSLSAPAFIAGPAAEMGRVRSDLEEARSSRMLGRDIPRPMNKADLARSRGASPARSVRAQRLL